MDNLRSQRPTRQIPSSPSKQTLPRATRATAKRLTRFCRTHSSVVAFFSLFLAICLLFIALDYFTTSATTQPHTTVPQTLASLSHTQNHHNTGSLKQLHALLQTLAVTLPEHNNSKFIIVTAVNYAYRQLALNFICNLQHLHISNYLILAMDKSVYKYLLNHHANVFFHQQTAPTLHRRLLSLSTPSEPHFGTALFVETSRRKSQLVLTILRLGYNVIFSDVDVALLQNPIPHLVSYQSDIVIQSDRPHFLRDAPLNYNINSGFYLVRPSARTVTAFRAILKYSQAIRRSEQKAFNYVLCGAFKTDHAGPGLRIGTDRCMYSRTDATVSVLPLDAFPNGSDQSLWSNATTRFTERHPDVVAVHANYVTGLAPKIDRLRTIGYWFLPPQSTQTAPQCILPS